MRAIIFWPPLLPEGVLLRDKVNSSFEHRVLCLSSPKAGTTIFGCVNTSFLSFSSSSSPSSSSSSSSSVGLFASATSMVPEWLDEGGIVEARILP